jgi:predicted nucleic acid-binding protein
VIFVDTSFFIALLDPRDRNHTRARSALEGFGGRQLNDLLLTTNNVILERITLARYEAGNRLAVRAGELLYAGKLTPAARRPTTFDSDFGHRIVMRLGPAR